VIDSSSTWSVVLADILVRACAGIAAGLRVFVLAFLFAAACMVSGWVLGLLFGIPRTLARSQGTQSPAQEPQLSGDGRAVKNTSRVNTNLEDISDWLTKMLVGVGLTQLYSVPYFVWKVAGKLDANGFGWDKHGQLLAVVVFFYFAPGGFWLSYVGTRTILTRLFAESESDLVKAADPANLRFGIAEKELVGGGSDLAEADRPLLNAPRSSLTTPLEKAAWGAAQARAGNLADAQAALEDAVSSQPNNSSFKQQLAKIYTVRGNHAGAAKLLSDIPGTEVAVLNALYEPKPQGFEKAIQSGETLLQREEFRKDPSLRVWMACGYAQQYGYRKAQNAPEAELASIKQKVLNEIDAAIALNPSTKEWLRSLWKPEANASDDDLTVFDTDDPDLQKRLE
jgi:hypothetical protein